MESSEFYSELKAKGLQLANHDGKLRVGPKEKLTKEDRELLKVLKEELLVLPAMKKVHSVSEHSERCEPKSRVFSREKVHTDADNKIFSNILNSNNVHNVHNVHQTENFELRQLGSWYFSDNQAGFEEGGDYSEYDAGSNKTALRILDILRNLTWPDFEVSVDGSMIILKRVQERYFPRKNKAESFQLNDESSKQE